jgi:hypothetical protein
MADATAALFMPPLVSRIESDQALANLRVLPLTTRDPSEMLERGDADLAVPTAPPTTCWSTSRAAPMAWPTRRWRP